MNILTPPQFKILQFAWRNNGFTIAELHESGTCGDVAPETARSTAKRVADKGMLEEVKEKGSPPRFVARISKQDYYIRLAKVLFGGCKEDEKQFFKWAMDQV
jgi:hypothetical protein